MWGSTVKPGSTTLHCSIGAFLKPVNDAAFTLFEFHNPSGHDLSLPSSTSCLPSGSYAVGPVRLTGSRPD